MKNKNKLIMIIIFGIIYLLVCTILVSANLSWEEQRRIAKDIGRKLDYEGSFRFAYYEVNKDYFAIFKIFNKKDSGLITFYKSSLDLDKQQFRCLVLHELGHDNDVKFNNNDDLILSEDIADKFMLKNNPICYDWKTTRYVGYE